MTSAKVSVHDNTRPAWNGAPVLRLRLLGHMAVEDSAGRISLPRTRKTRAILAILALATPRPVLRLTLTALLWSQRQQEQARASLRQAVHELQDVLGPGWGRLFHAERHHLTLRGDGLSVDALSLGHAAAPDLETLRLFQKDLLEDLAGLDPAFDRWLKEERCRLSRAAVSLGESILAEQRGTSGILEAAEHLLLIDRGHEGAWRAVIRSRAEEGDRQAARLAYDRCRAALAELGHGGPSRETEDLLVRIGGQASSAAIADEPIRTVRGTMLSGGGCSVRLGVLPLRAVDPAHPGHADGLGVGLAEEITTLLARFRWISCISGSSLTAISGDAGPGALPWEGMICDRVGR